MPGTGGFGDGDGGAAGLGGTSSNMVHPLPQAMDQPAHLTGEDTAFCTTGCFGTFCKWAGTYLIMIT